jgi:hypothetical protein
MSEVVKLQASDGHKLDAYVAKPDGKPWGGWSWCRRFLASTNLYVRSRIGSRTRVSMPSLRQSSIAWNVMSNYSAEASKEAMTRTLTF